MITAWPAAQFSDHRSQRRTHLLVGDICHDIGIAGSLWPLNSTPEFLEHKESVLYGGVKHDVGVEVPAAGDGSLSIYAKPSRAAVGLDELSETMSHLQCYLARFLRREWLSGPLLKPLSSVNMLSNPLPVVDGN